MKMTLLILHALTFVNVPYKWAGENPLIGLDCSGFVQKPLRYVGILKDEKDRTAQGIHDYLVQNYPNFQSGVKTDSILFFGKSPDKITHVAIALDEENMIECGGGSSTTRTHEAAVALEARVRIEKIKRRSDLVASIIVTY